MVDKYNKYDKSKRPKEGFPFVLVLLALLPLLSFWYIFISSGQNIQELEQNAVQSLRHIKDEAQRELEVVKGALTHEIGYSRRHPSVQLVLSHLDGDVPAEDLAIFASSLRENNHEATMIFLIEEQDLIDNPRIMEVSRAFRAEVAAYRRADLPAALRPQPGAARRWRLFLDRLAAVEAGAAVLLADVRGTFFQADPFAAEGAWWADPAGQRLWAFPDEGPALGAAGETAVGPAVAACFGGDLAGQLAGRPPVAAGLLLGGAAAARALAAAVAEVVGAEAFVGCSQQPGADQAVVTVLAHLGRVPSLALAAAAAAPAPGNPGGGGDGGGGLLVAVGGGRAQTDDQGAVFSAGGARAVIVSEARRSRELWGRLVRRYVYWSVSGAEAGAIQDNDIAGEAKTKSSKGDPRQQQQALGWNLVGVQDIPPQVLANAPHQEKLERTDPDGAESVMEGVCKFHYIRKDWDLFPKVCDLYAEYNKPTYEACCQKCGPDPDCNAFVWKEGACYMKTCKNRGLATPQYLPGVVTGFGM